MAHDQLETNSTNKRTNQECTEINKEYGEKTTTRYELTHSRGAHSSDVINEEPTNDINSLNVNPFTNHSIARILRGSDPCRSKVDGLRIHSSSEEEGSKQSSPLIAHSLPHSAHVCDVCYMTFKNSLDLDKHKVVHIHQKPHVCGIYKKEFPYPSALFAQGIHTGEKPNVCNICKKRFSQSSNLVIHKRIHTGQKPYSCDICKKRFGRSDVLRTHTRMHTGEKPYICDICKRGFSQSSNMVSHKRSHTGQRPYICDICKKRFSRSTYLAMHKRTITHHNPS